MSGFLLDTNVPSELTRTQPNARVEGWIFSQVSDLYLSVVTLGELRKGFRLLPAGGDRRARLERWFHDDLLTLFAGRILPVTQAVAERWGVLESERQLQGRPLSTADGQIAATALQHDLSLVTRNVRDFDGLGLTIVNPWEG